MKVTATTKDALDLLHRGTVALARMEHNGIRIDVNRLKEELANAKKQVQAAEADLYDDEVYDMWKSEYGDKLSLKSRPQLERILYDKMGFDAGVTTKTGRRYTGKGHLEKIDHPFVRKYLKYQKVLKTGDTFLRGIERERLGDILHPSYSLNIAVTYRSSSGEGVNFHNFPKRDEVMARAVRSCFIARDGNHLVENDFKGAEVNVGACHHHDPAMIRYIEDLSSNMHTDAACDLFFLTKDQVDKKSTRHWAKNQFVFPQFYGSVWFQCAPHLWELVESGTGKVIGSDLTVKQHLASKGIKELGNLDPRQPTKPGTFAHHVKEVERILWDQRFPVYKRWKQRRWEEYQRDGFFTSHTGFKFQWAKEGLMKRNEVTNYPIQCDAYHCQLWTQCEVQDALDKYKMKTLLVNQVHDSILADVPPDELQDYLDLVRDIVEVKLAKSRPWICVPMTVEAEVSPVNGSWFDIETWECKDGFWVPAA